ncbi:MULTISPECIES: SDR family NAD(P)-dependent oxidoreductase [Actinomadura]|jgi:3-oxoacyl-[acyl-carrier protein] reductase|uniref:3-oxoacyl-[acyl-carrier protein] reductase n=1 Tax=Actinomadura citrea TaxID=46158 RepID=A0A7Y9GBB0_9ACTN|nr:SDR family NAD(P)-dependent oxidoreductase [Actinomadura citrea]NYE13337.1 3-oxoacyl-[acyl-carrier protein] reductase [Actinomadura citrea]
MSETPSSDGPQRVVLVTGAAGGLGREFAIALAARGHRVAGLDLADLSGTADAIGDRFHPVRADVTDPDEVEAAVEETAARFGGLHIVVNNAGIYPPLEFEETTLEDWRRVMRVNLDGPFLVSRAALPHMKAAGWGRIVNIASAVVFLGPPDLVAYTTSKAGLVGFTRALASAVGSHGVTVNAIAPGLTRTGTAARTTGADGGFERVRDLQVVRAVEEPRDLLSTLLYVCDEGSGFLTGQTINVDGGSAMH